jgi:hypothetical protein
VDTFLAKFFLLQMWLHCGTPWRRCRLRRYRYCAYRDGSHSFILQSILEFSTNKSDFIVLWPEPAQHCSMPAVHIYRNQLTISPAADLLRCFDSSVYYAFCLLIFLCMSMIMFIIIIIIIVRILAALFTNTISRCGDLSGQSDRQGRSCLGQTWTGPLKPLSSESSTDDWDVIIVILKTKMGKNKFWTISDLPEGA